MRGKVWPLWPRCGGFAGAERREVFEGLNASRPEPLAYTTVLRFLQIMREKGLVERAGNERGHVFASAMPAERTKRQMVGDLVDRLFGGSVHELVLQALGSRKVSAKELREIRKLLKEARESLKQLLEKYDGANRPGCALLNLGQASTGAARLEYLTRAVEKFSDCYYFNGCQVGGYGRYVLALTLWENGEKDKSLSYLGRRHCVEWAPPKLAATQGRATLLSPGAREERGARPVFRTAQEKPGGGPS